MPDKHTDPAVQSHRIEIIDVLKGIAIFGILMVNMPLYFKPVSSALLGFTGNDSLNDQIAELFIKFFFEGKFYVLFSLLFGYNFWLFIERNKHILESAIPIQKRRFIFLLLIGFLHIAMLWAGDILFYYALFGLVLTFFVGKSDSSLIKWGIGISFIPVSFNFIFWIGAEIFSVIPEARRGLEAGMQTTLTRLLQSVIEASAVYSNGHFVEIMIIRLREFLSLMTGGLIFYYPIAMGMFLLGMWAGRKKLLSDFHLDFKIPRRLIIPGIITGIFMNLLYVISFTKITYGDMSIWTFIESLSFLVGGFLFCIVYVYATTFLLRTNKMIHVKKYLASVGKMSLTNYILQSLILTTLSLPYGFGYFGKISMIQGIMLTVVIYAFQIILSALWLRYFYSGPIEWVWKSVTYKKSLPFRKV